VIEILEAVFGAGECCLACVDLIMLGGDVVAWAQGRENRRQRRAAREAGQATVPLDFWNKAFWVMLAMVALLSAFIVYRLLSAT
jgi:hypothetical protein